MKKFEIRWLIPVFFLVITAIFFYKAFLGYSLQGTDTSLGIMKKFTSQIRFTSDLWLDNIWMGYKSGPIYASNPFTLIMKIAKTEDVQFLTYFVSLFLAMVFTYLFLRKLKLPILAAIFGSIAYAFTPHFITLATAAHITAIELIMFPPALFYFLTIAFDPEEKERFKTVLSVIFAGIVWGLMMTDEVQRGLYFSIAAAAYILFLMIRNSETSLKNALSIFTKKVFRMDLLKTVTIALMLSLSFASGFIGWLKPLQMRSSQTQGIEAPKDIEAARWENATSWSFHPLELIDSVAFGYHGNLSGDPVAPYWGSFVYLGSSEALGFFVVLFALIGIFVYFRREKIVRIFFWIGLVSLLLSFGRFIPGLPFFWLFYKLPLMGNFRIPAKFLAVTAFAVSILAAYGFGFIFRMMQDDTAKHKKILSLMVKILSIFLGIGLIWMFFVMITSTDIAIGIGQKLNNSGMSQKAVTNIILALTRMNVFTALSIGALALYLRLENRKWALPLTAGVFMLMMIIDLWGIDWYYLNKAYFKINETYREDGTVLFLKNEYRTEIFRVGTALQIPIKAQLQTIPTTGIRGYYLTYSFPYFGIQPMDIPAISGIVPEYNNFFMRTLVGSLVRQINTLDELVDLNARLLQLANVKYLILDSTTTSSNVLLTNIVRGYDGRDKYIYYVKNYLPRIGFYGSYRAVTNNDMEPLYFIGDTAADIRKEAVVLASSNFSSVTPGKVVPQQLISYKSYEVIATVAAPSGGFVLFTTKYEPDWKAYLNGKPAKVYKANYLQMGVFVEKGEHRLVFRFEPDSRPFLISLITVLAGLAAAAVFGLRKGIALIKNKK